MVNDKLSIFVDSNIRLKPEQFLYAISLLGLFNVGNSKNVSGLMLSNLSELVVETV